MQCVIRNSIGKCSMWVIAKSEDFYVDKNGKCLMQPNEFKPKEKCDHYETDADSEEILGFADEGSSEYD